MSHLRTETRLLALLPTVALFFGSLDYGPAHGPSAGSSLPALHAAATLLLVTAWVAMDARRRGGRVSFLLVTCLLSATVVALPYYLVRSRGVGGGLRALGLSFLVFAATMTAYRFGALFG